MEIKDNWFIMQEIPNTNYLFWVDPLLNVTKGFEDWFKFCPDGALIFKDDLMYFTFNRVHWRKMGEYLMKRFTDNPGWQREINELIKKRVDELHDFAQTFLDMDFSAMADKQLIEHANAFFQKYREGVKYGNLQVAYEFDHQLLTKYLRDYLKSIGVEDVSGVFSKLTTFLEMTAMQKEKYDRMKLMKSDNPDMESHYKKYCWLEFMYQGPVYDKDHFNRLLEEDKKKGVDPDRVVKEMDERSNRLLKEQKDIFKKYSIDEKHKSMFLSSRDMIYLKGYRKDATAHAFFCLERLLKEISKRTDIPMLDLFMCIPDELEKIFYTVPENLSERRKNSIFYVLDCKVSLETGEKAEELAKEIFAKAKEELTEDFVQGTCAVPGKAKGKVRIINDVNDLSKMQKGDILVSNATYPSLVVAMEKASAIVTDLGGLTCHAAIVSRELGIPCIVGTKIATKVFKDDDLVEVDADKGTVIKTKK